MDSKPIKYSDLIQPDNSINDLIAKLEQLGQTFSSTIAGIKQQATGLTASLQNVNGATTQGQAATRQAAADTDRLAQAQKQLAFAQSENAKKLAQLKAQTKEANDITKLTEKLNRSAEGSYNRLSAQYSLNKIRLNQMTQAERENTAAGRQLVKETDAIYQRMKGLQEVTGKYQLNVGNYTNSILAAVGANRGFAGSLVMMGGGMQTATMSVKAFGTALMGLLANPVFLAIAGVAAAGAAFKFWADYNDGIAEANRLTREFLGANGLNATAEQISGIRGEIQAMADVYGKEYKETLEGVDTLMSQFGLTAAEAMNILNKGFAAGADLNGDMLSQIQQYAPALHDAGLRADELVALIAQTRSGLFGKDGLELITQASKRIRDMSSGARSALQGIGINADEVVRKLASGEMSIMDAIRQISERLKSVGKDSQEAGAIITDIFGRSGVKAGQEQIKALSQISTELDKMVELTGEYGQNQMEMVRVQKELNQYTEALFGMNGWEEMKQKAELYAKTALVAVLKGIVDITNWFVRMYNKSEIVRGAVHSLKNSFALTFGFIGNGFKTIVKVIEGVATALEGLANHSLKQVAQGVGMVQGAWVGLAKATGNAVADAFKSAQNAMTSGHLNEIALPDSYDGSTLVGVSGSGGGSGSGSGKGGSGKGGSSNATNAAEQLYKKRLDLMRKAQDEQLKAMDEGFAKERLKTKYEYNRKIEDLRHQLQQEGSEREKIEETIAAIQLQLYKKWNELDAKEQKANLEQVKKTIAQRLQAVKEGSAEEYELKRAQIENDRQLALLEGNGEADAIAAKRGEELSREYLNAQMDIFDTQQEYAANEFALLKTTEAEKTKFKLEQERARWKKILEINALGNKVLSDEEIQNIRNIIARIDGEIDAIGGGGKMPDLYDVFGLKLTDDEKKAINTSLSQAMQAIDTFTQAQVKAAEAAVKAANDEVSAAQKVLDKELEARANGYANNVLYAQKQLDEEKKNQEKALAQQRRAQRAQEVIQAVQQAGNLITASSMIWAQLGFPWAIPAIAVMWGSFLAAKVKALQMTKSEQYGEGTLELLEGGSHASGNDIDLGTKKDGTRRRAEGGEFFAVINKRSSRKYRRVIPDIIKSLNEGTFAEKYAGAFDGGSPVLQVNNVDLTGISADVRAIRDNNSKRVYVDAHGRTIEVGKNYKRIIR